MSESSRKQFLAFLAHYRSRRINLSTNVTEGDASPDNEPRRKQLKYLHEYLHLLRPYRIAILVLVASSLLLAAFAIAQPLLVRLIVDHVLLGRYSDSEGKLRRLNVACIAFSVLVLASQVLGVLQSYTQSYLIRSLMLHLRRSLFTKLVRLPIANLRAMKVGGILSRQAGDVDLTASVLEKAILLPSVSFLQLVIAIVILSAINWRLALTAIAVIPGILFVSSITINRIRPIYVSLREDAARIDGRAGETFAGIRIVRTFRREAHELLEYMRGRHVALRKEVFARSLEIGISTAFELLVGTVIVAVFWYGGYLYVRGAASIGDIVAFQWYTLLLLGPASNIVNSFSELQRSLAATGRVFDVLAMPEDKPDEPDAITAPTKVHEIRFENVSFEYHENSPVIHDFDVVVPGGSVVALVGHSGAGKTTIADLVCRFHDPTKGRILLNGIDIRKMRQDSLRKLFATVQQDVFLFDGSIAENIAYGGPHATVKEIEQAARHANAHEFIETLPQKYATSIGERGVRLSGGQQQRLALARAFLTVPEILILDEATSHLDTESEQLIQTSIEDLIAGRTTFIIAHRLSTVRRADLILVMNRGRIVERGTHEELMGINGVYCRMVSCQLGWPEVLL
jgi:ATP-binding cassette subfamily B protein